MDFSPKFVGETSEGNEWLGKVDEFRICIGGRANSNPIYEWTGVGREKREIEAEFYILGHEKQNE